MLTIIFTEPGLTHTDDIPEMAVALQLSADNLRWLLDKAQDFSADGEWEPTLTQHVYRTNDIQGFQLLTYLRDEKPANVTQDPAAEQTWCAGFAFDTHAKEPSFRLDTETAELPWLPEDENDPYDDAVIVTVTKDAVFLGRERVCGDEENQDSELEVRINNEELPMLLEAASTGKAAI